MHDDPRAAIVGTMSGTQKAIPFIVNVSQRRDGIVDLMAWFGADVRRGVGCIWLQAQPNELLKPLR